MTEHGISIGVALSEALTRLGKTRRLIEDQPYCLQLYIRSAEQYLDLVYPDLAAGDSYKALLLSDAIQDESDEVHDLAVAAFSDTVVALPADEQSHDNLRIHEGVRGPCNESDQTIFVTELLSTHYLPLIYRLLTRSLLLCGSYQSAFLYCTQACKLYPKDDHLQNTSNDIRERVARSLNMTKDELDRGEYSNPSSWPNTGFVRREQYPWNNFEPARLEDIETLNSMMHEVAPKMKVRAVELPNLTASREHAGSLVSKQLGVFAKEDIAPGEIVLIETSMLTANNKLLDALCDACSADLPELDSAEASHIVSCPDCEVVFCSQQCYDDASTLYHPALCGMDVEALAKDVAPTEAADALYSLLLLRCLAMAETQQLHPLDLKEVKYIWGDFHNAKVESNSDIPKTLPFSFDQNIKLPFHMLEKMDIDIFVNQQYDVWVLNTLYAKFRGTASARLSGMGGRSIRGPEVSAVHPMWCLANHSCDPNVSWDWGGNIKFWAREERVQWKRDSGKARRTSEAGIKKGEEVFNHYCDIDLPVKDRREWARGALGGDCRCARCLWEAGESDENGT